ncbi:hypothetical protein ACLOJK_004697 [Asimina triloba]
MAAIDRGQKQQSTSIDLVIYGAANRANREQILNAIQAENQHSSDRLIDWWTGEHPIFGQ